MLIQAKSNQKSEPTKLNLIDIEHHTPEKTVIPLTCYLLHFIIICSLSVFLAPRHFLQEPTCLFMLALSH
jgi:hypothetical protein